MVIGSGGAIKPRPRSGLANDTGIWRASRLEASNSISATKSMCPSGASFQMRMPVKRPPSPRRIMLKWATPCPERRASSRRSIGSVAGVPSGQKIKTPFPLRRLADRSPDRVGYAFVTVEDGSRSIQLLLVCEDQDAEHQDEQLGIRIGWLDLPLDQVEVSEHPLREPPWLSALTYSADPWHRQPLC